MKSKIFSKNAAVFLWQVLYRGASRTGERLGWNWLIYNWGVTLSFHRTALRNAPKFVDAVTKALPALKSVADIGCGTGCYLAEFQRRGLRVRGCEFGRRPRRWAARQGVQVEKFDLSRSTQPLPDCPYDLVMSIEVAEHVPAPLAERLVEFISMTGDLIVFTAAQPGVGPRYGSHGHINEQPKSYWIEKFARFGFKRENDLEHILSESFYNAQCARFLYSNLTVFKRS